MALNPYYQDDLVTIYHGDSLEVLPTLKGSSVDLVVTDRTENSNLVYTGPTPDIFDLHCQRLAPGRIQTTYIAAASPDVVLALLARVQAAEAALTEIADWGAHTVDSCAAYDSLTGKPTDRRCTCGWDEIADVARIALGREPKDVAAYDEIVR